MNRLACLHLDDILRLGLADTGGNYFYFVEVFDRERELEKGQVVLHQHELGLGPAPVLVDLAILLRLNFAKHSLFPEQLDVVLDLGFLVLASQHRVGYQVVSEKGDVVGNLLVQALPTLFGL